MNGSPYRDDAASDIVLAFLRFELSRQRFWLSILGSWITVTTAVHLSARPVNYPKVIMFLMSIAVFAWIGFTVIPDVASRSQAFLRTRPLPRATLWNVRSGLLAGLPIAATLALTWVLSHHSSSGWPDGSAWVTTSAQWTGSFGIIAAIAAISSSSIRFVFFTLLALSMTNFPLLGFLAVNVDFPSSPPLGALLMLVLLIASTWGLERASGWKWQPLRALCWLWAILAFGCLVMPSPSESLTEEAADTEARVGLEPIYDLTIGPESGHWICASTKPGRSFEALKQIELTSVSLVDEDGRVVLHHRLEKAAESHWFNYSRQNSPAWTYGDDFCMDPERTTDRLSAADRQWKSLRWRVEGRAGEFRRTPVLRFPMPQSSGWSWAERTGLLARGRLGRVKVQGSLLTAELGISTQWRGYQRTYPPYSLDPIVRWVGPERSWHRPGFAGETRDRYYPFPRLGLTWLNLWRETYFALTFVAPSGNAASLLEGSSIEVYEAQVGAAPFVAEASVGDLADWRRVAEVTPLYRRR